MDTIDLRCKRDSGGDARVVVHLRAADASLEVAIDGHRSTHVVPLGRVASIVTRIERTAVPPVGAQPAGGAAVGYDMTFTSGMAQSAFRWVAAVPAGWEPFAESAEELLALARDLTRSE